MADDKRGTLYGHSIPDGPVVPDAEEVARVKARDARIKAYRARERAKVVAAFDRFLERMWNDPYGERPEWADPPVWLRAEAERTGGGGPGLMADVAVTRSVCDRTGEPGHLHVWQAGRCVAPTDTFVCCPSQVVIGNTGHQCAGEKGVPHEHSYPTAPVGIHQKAHYGVPAEPRGWLIEHTDRHRPESPVLGCTFCVQIQDKEHRNPDYVAGAEAYACPDCGDDVSVGDDHQCDRRLLH